MTEPTYRRKLIEVALPLDAINKEAAREKSIRHGHPSTLHLWWARRPLAACRAVLFSQLVDDPSAHPDRFPTEAQEIERQRLFRIIEELVKWENVTNESVLEAARNEIRRSCDGYPPPIVDPFAGGGSIPLEAHRLGLEAHGSDLNPVAVLINKALVEIPPRFADRPPVHPSDDNNGSIGTSVWRGAQGLAADVRYYGEWMRGEAERRIGHLYPQAKMPDGSSGTVIAWIWARTVSCPNPACGVTMPLARSFWLGKKKGKETWINPIVEGRQVRFEIGHGKHGPPVEGTVTRTGARCLVCDSPVPLEHLRGEGRARRLGTRLMAVVAEGNRQRVYLPPSEEHVAAAAVPLPDGGPDSELPSQALGFRVQAYGMTRHADLFTPRQLTALCVFSDLVGDAQARATSDAMGTGLSQEDSREYGRSVATLLALAVGRCADYWSALCTWASQVKQEGIGHTFTSQTLSMTWDIAEANPFSDSSGNFRGNVATVCRVVEVSPCLVERKVVVSAQNATARSFEGLVVATDPPYYDNIGYADLADFFYVWLRRALREAYPDLFSTMLTPKAEELVATPFRFDGSKELAKDFFEAGFIQTFGHARQQQVPGYPMTIFYAFKQSEDHAGDGTASTGWETLLQGLLIAGLSVTGTWPMRTELSNRPRSSDSNALASSIVLVCRPRPESAGVTDRAGFLNALRAELPKELHVLQQAAIAPVDLAQAAIGPGMAVFSRYAKVIEPSGESMRVRTALGLINQVLAEVLDQQDGELDPDTRWAVKWFEQRGHDEGPFGEAQVLATALGLGMDGLERSGIISARAGKVRLLERAELPDGWDPVSDSRVSVWEATQHLVKSLEDGGESAAAALLERLGGMADSAQLLAYRLYAVCERKGWATEAQPYNALAAVWGSLRATAASSPASVTAQSSLFE